MAAARQAAVFLLGPGLIGRALLGQLASQASFLRDKLSVDLGVFAIANSKRMWLSQTPIATAGGAWQAAFQAQGEPTDMARLSAHIRGNPAPCKVLVDCSASDDVPDAYASLMRAGVHVVTPNKKMGAGSLARFQEVKSLQQQGSGHFFYEATVGAGLPIISTLKGLIETGDEVVSVEGILSGTLSYIFNTYQPGMKFSDVVGDAKAKGFTEPDPREDLSGADVARKVVILARECGLQVGMDDLHVESLVPKPLQSVATADEYMARLPEFDSEMGALADAAAAAGSVIRYVGRVDAATGACSVKMAQYPAAHPFAQLSGSDNMVVFTTKRYASRPLIVRGPGAGAEVTAAGVFSDILQILRHTTGMPTL